MMIWNNANSELLVNIASDEYYKSVIERKLKAEIIKPVFLDQKNGKYKVISFYAKKARGLMARYMIENQLSKVEDLKSFNIDGYYFDAKVHFRVSWSLNVMKKLLKVASFKDRKNPDIVQDFFLCEMLMNC